MTDHQITNPYEAPMNDPLLQMQQISKRFGSTQVLENVSITVKPGEVHALLGENGAGKSTLLKILFGTHAPDGGQVKWRGQAQRFRSSSDALRAGIAMIHQELALVPEMSIAQNIWLGREGPGASIRRGELERRSLPALEAVGLHLAPSTPVRLLSTAQQQLVEIARAISSNAALIVMDEPTSSLAKAEIDHLYGIVRQLKAKGVSVIYVSHHLNELEALADRVTVLRDGQLIGCYEMREKSRDQLIALMVGREIERSAERHGKSRREVVLSARGLTRKGAFADISFDLHQGEILAIAGLVGAGRSDVLRAIFGRDRLDAGQVTINGLPFHPSPPEAVRRGIGLIPEDRRAQGIFPDASIATNALLTHWGLSKQSKHHPEHTRRVVEMTQNLNVKPRDPNRTMRLLSGGNQQKVIFGRWLIAGSRVLLIDEPTRGIDVVSKQEIYTRIQTLADNGIAVLMVSSELPEVLRLSERILVMRAGRIVQELQTAEATEESILAYATGSQPTVQPPPNTLLNTPLNMGVQS
jgi:ribose transport system ATP-binding protein